MRTIQVSLVIHDNFDSVTFTLSNGLKNHTLSQVGSGIPTHQYTVPISD